MLDLNFFSNPAKLKQRFLALSDIPEQHYSDELALEFEKVRKPELINDVDGNFWWALLYAFKNLLGKAIALRGLATLCLLATVLTSKEILETTAGFDYALMLVAIFTVLRLVQATATSYAVRLQDELYPAVRLFVTNRMNWKLLRLGELNDPDFSTGNLKTLVSSDIYRIADFIIVTLRNGAPVIIGLIILGPFIYDYAGDAGVWALASAFAALPIAYFWGFYITKQEIKVKSFEDNLATTIGEWVSHVRLLRYLGWQDSFSKHIENMVNKLIWEATKQHGANLLNFGLSVMWWTIPIIVLLAMMQASGTQATTTEVFAAIWLLNNITLFVREMPFIFIAYASSAASVQRLQRLFNEPDLAELVEVDYAIDSLEKKQPVALSLENISFKYKHQWIFQDFSLLLDLRQSTALIGAVGSGKSTLAKLLCAELKPQRGKIFVLFESGEKVGLWHENIRRHWQNYVAYMPQEAFLSNASLHNNVSLDDEDHSAKTMRAIHLAELNQDILGFKNGLNEEIGETGVNLSGGQKQRVNLARALYSQREFMVLDDPLSAVDSHTEQALMRGIRSVGDQFFLISHRLSQLHLCDRVLTLTEGKLSADYRPKGAVSFDVTEADSNPTVNLHSQQM